MIFKIKPFKKISLHIPYLFYKNKVLSDFIFFIYVFKEYTNLYIVSTQHFLTVYIYILNLIAVKYIIFYKNITSFFIKENCSFKIYNMQLIY